MSILIKGMDMPKEGTYILNFISSEKGKHTICLIEKEHDDGGAELIEHNGVVEVKEPHGRLIDADKLYKEVEGHEDDNIMINEYQAALNDAYVSVEYDIEDAPTVIEAEGKDVSD